MLRTSDTGTIANLATITVSAKDHAPELLALLRRFVSSRRTDFSYQQFRRELVEGFFHFSDVEPTVAHWYNQIESGCAAFDHQVIDAIGLHCYFNGLLGQIPRRAAGSTAATDQG